MSAPLNAKKLPKFIFTNIKDGEAMIHLFQGDTDKTINGTHIKIVTKKYPKYSRLIDVDIWLNGLHVYHMAENAKTLREKGLHIQGIPSIFKHA